MTDLKPEDLVKRATDLLRAVERFIRAENAHAKRIMAHRNKGGESAHDDEAPTSRDAVDLAHADLMSDFTAADCKLALSLLADRARMEKALERIERWFGEFPETGDTWEDGSPVSYATLYGSNGERDYMREIARQALGESQ